MINYVYIAFVNINLYIDMDKKYNYYNPIIKPIDFRNEIRIKIINAYLDDDNEIIITKEIKDMMCINDKKEIRTILKLANAHAINYRNGFIPKYKIDNRIECESYLLDQRINMNDKCFLYSLQKLGIEIRYYPNRELSKILYGVSCCNKRLSSIDKRLLEATGKHWYQILKEDILPKRIKQNLDNIITIDNGEGGKIYQYDNNQLKGKLYIPFKCRICGCEDRNLMVSGRLCKICHNKILKERRKNEYNNIDGLSKRLYLNSKKSYTKKEKDICFNITPEDVKNKIIEQDFKCAYTGLDLYYSEDKKHFPTIDRIDSNIGYTSDNIVIVSFTSNIMKNDLSFDDFKYMIKLLYNKLIK